MIILLPVSCKECPTEPDYDISLSVEDVACVWVTLNVTLPDSGKINTFALERNDSTIATFTCFDDDTLITDEGLTPDNDYSYTIRFLKDGQTKAESDPVSVHTLPTTSHDFTWEIDVLGNYGSCLNDVWIGDENNIWVVGNIETNTGEYNAAHWNGEEWELLGIYSNTLDLYSIWYFSHDDIWVTSGVPIHWNGNEWLHYHLWSMGILNNDDGGVEHIWASSPDDIYFVGRKGSIVHYDGSTFRKIESGTEMYIKDVHGFDDNTIYCAAVRIQDWTSNLIQIRNNQVVNQYHDDIYRGGIWSPSPYYLFAVGQGLFKYNTINQTMTEQTWPSAAPLWLVSVIDGTVVNNVFTGGHNSIVFHYNGESWHYYPELLGYDVIHGVDVKDNMVVFVGHNNNQVCIIIGKKE